MANIAARASQDLVGNWRIPRDVDISWDPRSWAHSVPCPELLHGLLMAIAREE